MGKPRFASLAAEVAHWRKALSDELSYVEPEDLDLVIWSVLRRKYGGRLRFLLRQNPDGTGFVF